jgi:hypothetical protein
LSSETARAFSAARQMAAKSPPSRTRRRSARRRCRLREKLRGVVGLDAAAVEDLHVAASRVAACSCARSSACTACACSGVAVLPVPIAQTGS